MKGRALYAIAGIGAAGLVAFALIEVASVSDGGVRVGVKKAVAECNEKAPECLPELTMVDTNGTAWSPESLRGKVVLVNFWATWCEPCQQEIPALAELQEEHGDDVVLIGVLTDTPTTAELATFVEEHGVNYPIVRGGAELLQAFDFQGRLPVTYIYDRSGHLEERYLGRVRHDEMSEKLGGLLAE